MLDFATVLALAVVVLSAVVLFIVRRSNSPALVARAVEDEDEDTARDRVDADATPTFDTSTRQGRRMMKRFEEKQASKATTSGAPSGQADDQADAGSDVEDTQEEEPSGSSTAVAPGKLGKKKLEKLQMKEAKKQQREAELSLREEKKAQQEAEYAEWAEEKAKERELERIKAEAAALEKKKKEEAEQAEYEKWKNLISVKEESSVAADTAGESGDLLGEFIRYIKEHKVVILEDVARKFGLRTEEAVNRIKGVEAMGSLTGVFDDRGKYIYITEEEYAAVAKFIKQRGRVTIPELTKGANDLVRTKGKKLKDKDKDKDKDKEKDKTKEKDKEKDKVKDKDKEKAKSKDKSKGKEELLAGDGE